MDDERIGRLAGVFKALADPARLRILGTIAERPQTGRELSERLGLTPPTISHHMARLVEAGLVRVTPEAQRRTYSLDLSALRDLARDDASSRDAPEFADSGDDPERAKVLRDFFAGERLTQIPAQRRKRVIVLQHLLTRFEPHRDYPEREANDILRLAHEDVATLRRELVDYGYMTRGNGVYRVASALPARGPTVTQEIVGDEASWLRNLVAGVTARAIHRGAPARGAGSG